MKFYFRLGVCCLLPIIFLPHVYADFSGDNRQVLTAYLRLAVCCLLPIIFLPHAYADLSGDNRQILTNAGQIRALSIEVARLHQKVCLRGVVVLEGAGAGKSIVLVDETAGIYLEDNSGKLAEFHVGDVLSVQGNVDPGKFAPIVEVTSVIKVGTGMIPPPKVVSYSDLQTGCFDAQWVEVSGVVRRSEMFSNSPTAWKLWLSMGEGQLPVLLSTSQGKLLAVDSEVRLRGVCFYQFNTGRQMLSSVLQLPSSQSIFVIRPAPRDPFAVPERPIGKLLQFSPVDIFTHRVLVAGIVTCAINGEGFWIHSGQEGLRVHSFESPLPEVGDSVDVLGFLSRGGYSPVLEDAVFRKRGQSGQPVPLSLANSQQALDHDNDLIRMDAEILEQWQATNGYRLMLKDRQGHFLALLKSGGFWQVPKTWQPHSLVRIIGICTITADSTIASVPGTVYPASFQILVRSPNDITVLKAPPWWTMERLAWLLGLGLGAVASVLVFVFVRARHRLRQQALARTRSEAEFVGVLNERNRVAREIHDTLAQGFTAISMQLEVVKRQLSPESNARGPLDVARRLARENMAEARNAVWNVRSPVLEKNDLGTALGEVLKDLTEGTEIKGELRVRGKLRRLAPATEENLLRMGREAITNAVKYARATNILVALDFDDGQLRLTVWDDGQGFNVQSPPPSEGGFGLVGMRERAAQMHAEFSMTSEPGEGTIITLVLPISN